MFIANSHYRQLLAFDFGVDEQKNQNEVGADIHSFKTLFQKVKR